MARKRIPGLTPEAERVVNALLQELDERIHRLEAKPGRPGTITTSTVAREGEFLTFEAPPTGITCVLPTPTSANRNARVTLSFKNGNSVRLTCLKGTINRTEFVINTAPGTIECICDGETGWSVDTGVTPTGTASNGLSVITSTDGTRGPQPRLRMADQAYLTWTQIEDVPAGEIELTATVDNLPLTNLELFSPNTGAINATGGTANATEFAMAQDSLWARVGANIVSHPFSTLFGEGLSYTSGAARVGLTSVSRITRDASSITWSGFDLAQNGGTVAPGWVGIDIIDTATTTWATSAPGGGLIGLGIDVNMGAAYDWTGLHTFDNEVRILATNPLLFGDETVGVAGVPGFLPPTGDIRKSDGLNLYTNEGMIHLRSFGISTNDGVKIEGTVVELESDADLTIHGTAVTIKSGGTAHKTLISNIANGPGFLALVESSSSTPTVSAGEGMLWVKNNAPTVPMFTGDTNVDFQLPFGVGLMRAPQVLTSGTSISHPAGSRFIYVRGAGGGGAGGGTDAAAGSIGGMGGSGTYGERFYTLASLSSTYTVGSGGNGSAGNAGGSGGSSTFTHNSVTITLPGGGGGQHLPGGTSVARVLGGSPGAAATNADFSTVGQRGGAGARFGAIASALHLHTGPAGSTPLGNGGGPGISLSSGLFAPEAGSGFGGGGAGILNGSSTTATAGADGAPGGWIVEEYG